MFLRARLTFTLKVDWEPEWDSARSEMVQCWGGGLLAPPRAVAVEMRPTLEVEPAGPTEGVT